MTSRQTGAVQHRRGDTALIDDSTTSRLRDALARQFTFAEENAEEFLRRMLGRSRASTQLCAPTADARWLDVTDLLPTLEAPESARSVLRISIRGWVGFLDEIVLDHLHHHELSRTELVDLAMAALMPSLRAASSRAHG